MASVQVFLEKFELPCELTQPNALLSELDKSAFYRVRERCIFRALRLSEKSASNEAFQWCLGPIQWYLGAFMGKYKGILDKTTVVSCKNMLISWQITLYLDEIQWPRRLNTSSLMCEHPTEPLFRAWEKCVCRALCNMPKLGHSRQPCRAHLRPYPV